MQKKIVNPDPIRIFTNDGLGKSLGKKTDSAASLRNLAPPSTQKPPKENLPKKH